MNACPKCGKKPITDAGSCPDCEKRNNDSPGFLNLPREFWITLIGTICVLIVTLVDWIRIGGANFTLFGLWWQSADLEWLQNWFWEIAPIRAYISVLAILLVFSYVLLIASLIKYKSKYQRILCFSGFGLAVFVAAAFNIVIVLDYVKLAGIELTMFALLTFVIGVFSVSLIKKIPTTFGEWVRIITRLFIYVSFAALLALLILTVIDVVRRMIFGIALTGVAEFSQIFLIVSLCAMAQALIEGKFIVVTTLVERFHKWLNLGVEVFMGICSLAFFALVGWQLISQVESSILFREAYFMIQVPRWPMYGILGSSLLACGLATIAYVYERFKNYKAPNEKNVLDDPEIAFVTKGEGGVE